MIEKFGGMPGIRDYSLLESALARQRNLAFYVPESDIFDIAAVIMCGIIKNHPFFDGNKRTGMAAGLSFLQENSCTLTLKTNIGYEKTIDIATGKLNEQEISTWLRSYGI